jgi:tetratricopeptide (TPR) repeat protein
MSNAANRKESDHSMATPLSHLAQEYRHGAISLPIAASNKKQNLTSLAPQFRDVPNSFPSIAGWILEYVSGGDLATWINSQRLAGDLQTVLRFAIQFCDGMVHMPCFLEAAKLGDTNASRGVAQCRKLLKLDAEKYFQRGSDFQEAGNNSEAIRCYDAGLSIDPSNPDAWINKGAALLALKRGSEAIACFDRAIALNPRDAGAWNNKGCALLSMNQQSEALACLQEAKRLRT